MNAVDLYLALDEKMGWKGENTVAVFFERARGIDHLEALESHPNYHIYERSSTLISKYWGKKADDAFNNNNEVE